ncbi:hypothetical protein ABPG75_002019 [Micractinium tetrahymenae]
MTTATSPAGGSGSHSRPRFTLQVEVEKFSGTRKENPETFLKILDGTKTLYGWTDEQALAYASLSLRGKAQDWFNNQEITTWAGFKKALVDRFGLDPNKMLSALTRRKQKDGESTRDYADALRTLVRYSRDPQLQATLQYFFIEGLQPDAAIFVKAQRPKNFEDAVELGEYFEENFTAGIPMPAVRAATRGADLAAAVGRPAPADRSRRALQDASNTDPIANLTRQMEKLSLKLMDMEKGWGGRNDPPAGGSAPRPRPAGDYRPPAGRPAQARCFKCGQEGHMARECTYSGPAPGSLGINLMAWGSDSSDDETEEETAYEDELYIQHQQRWPAEEEWYLGKRTGEEMEGMSPPPVARRFKPTPFNPGELPRQATQAAPAARPAAAPAPVQAAQARRPVPAARPGPAAAAAQPRLPPAARNAAAARAQAAAQAAARGPAPQPPAEPEARRRTGPAPRANEEQRQAPRSQEFSLVDQLNATPARMSLGGVLRHSRVHRQEAKDWIELLDQADTAGRAEVGRIHLILSSEPTTAGAGPTPPPDSHPAPEPEDAMATPPANLQGAIEVQEADFRSAGTDVLRTTAASIMGTPFTAIIDSGSSNTVCSQLAARKLQLLDKLEPTKATFITAAGTREKPWGVLRDLPVQVGDLSLPLKVHVTGATSYHLLIGNDWLSLAGANLDWGEKKLRFLVGPDQWQEVDVEYVSRKQRRHAALLQLEPDPPGQTQPPLQAASTASGSSQAEPAQQDALTAAGSSRAGQAEARPGPGDAAAELSRLTLQPGPPVSFGGPTISEPPSPSGNPEIHLAFLERLPSPCPPEDLDAQEEGPEPGTDDHSPPALPEPVNGQADEEGTGDDSSSLGSPAASLLSLWDAAPPPPPTDDTPTTQEGAQGQPEPHGPFQAQLDMPTPTGTSRFTITSTPYAVPPPPPDWPGGEKHCYHPLLGHQVEIEERRVPRKQPPAPGQKETAAVMGQPRPATAPSPAPSVWDDTSRPPTPDSDEEEEPESAPLLMMRLCPSPPTHLTGLPLMAAESWSEEDDDAPGLISDCDSDSGEEDEPSGCQQRGNGWDAPWAGQHGVRQGNQAAQEDWDQWFDGWSDDDSPPQRHPFAPRNWTQPPRLRTQPSGYIYGPTATRAQPEQMMVAALHEELEEPEPPPSPGDIWERLNQMTFGPQLSPAEVQALKDLLWENRDVFSWHKWDLGRAHVTHTIETGDHPPIAVRPYRLSHYERQEVQKEIQRMHQAGIIRPSTSPWHSPLVAVPKPSGGIRMTVDLRKLNAIIQRPQTPLPRIDDMLDAMRGSRFWSVCDCRAGFFQLPLREEDMAKTAFSAGIGGELWEFTVMPQGLSSSPARFQALMTQAFAPFPNVMAYLDDCVAHSRTFEDHLEHVGQMLGALRQAGIKIAPEKCKWGVESMTFLGIKVSAEGNEPDPAKVAAIVDCLAPTNQKEVRARIGLCSYYRRWIKNFAGIARPLTDLLRADAEFNWSPVHEAAFQALKKALTSEPVLRRPDWSKPFILQTDWQPGAVAAILAQKADDGKASM